jgi:hypothetical protein
MTMNKNTLLALTVLGTIATTTTITSVANAQVDDALASTSFEYYPKSNYGDNGGKLQLNVFRASVGVPIPVAEKTTLVAGASYEMLDIHPSDSETFQLHAPVISAGVVQGIGDHWGVMAFADLGFASDFSEKVGSDDVLASLTGVVTYKLSESFTIGAGAVYDRRTGQLAPLPALLLNLRISERARVRGFVPSYLTAEYRATNWLDVGIRSTFEGNRFHLGEKKFGAPDLELAYSTLTVGPKVTLNVTDWVHFDIYAAAAPHRRYEVFQNDESMSKTKIDSTIAYGARFWIGPSGWEQPKPRANENGEKQED